MKLIRNNIEYGQNLFLKLV